MKIASAEISAIKLPALDPLAPPHPLTENVVTLKLRTADGIEGQGVTSYGAGITRALKAAVEDLASLMTGEDPLLTERIAAKARAAAGSSGPAGIFTLALSAIDMACWDIKGKALGLPLWKMLGGTRRSVPAYASNFLHRDLSDDQLAKVARRLVEEEGYKAVKMNLAMPGPFSPAREIARAALVRQAVGPATKLMVDINWGWSVGQAIDMGKRLEPFNLGWIEDPTASSDYAGLAEIAAALTTPICAGESLYGIASFTHLLAARAVDIVMVDLWRAGGITPWPEIAAMCEVFNLPVVSHLLAEVHMHIVGALPNGLTVEYAPWFAGLYEDAPKPVKGEMILTDKPGLGIVFDEAVLKRQKIG